MSRLTETTYIDARPGELVPLREALLSGMISSEWRGTVQLLLCGE